MPQVELDEKSAPVGKDIQAVSGTVARDGWVLGEAFFLFTLWMDMDEGWINGWMDDLLTV
jgi:hypothetical protein